MSSGTGVGFLDDIIDVSTNFGTGGLVGFDEEGFGTGVTSDIAIDATKEITGAAAAEEANAMALEQAREDRQARLDQRATARTQQRNRQISASNAAGASRRSVTNTSQARGSSLGGDEGNLLGL